MKVLRLIFLIVFIQSGVVNAQSTVWQNVDKNEIKREYQNASNWMLNTPSYFFKLRYSAYQDHSTNVPLETSQAYYKRVSNNLISEALGIKTIQNSKLKCVIDSSSKTVTLMSPTSLSLSIADNDEMETMLNYTKSLKKTTLSDKTICYRVEFFKNKIYDAYEFSINKKGLLERLIFYYSEQSNEEFTENNFSINNNDQKSSKPRLEIVFYDYQVPAKYTENEFENANIVVNSNGKLVLNSSYKNYRLLDYRLKNE